MVFVNIFHVVRNEISVGSDRKCNFPHRPLYCKNLSLLATSCIYMTLPRVGDFYIGGLCKHSMSFVGSKLNFVSEYIKIVDAYYASFSSK